MAPPGITQEQEKTWVDALTTMHDSKEWQAQLEKNGWVDAFATGDEFGTFLTEQDKAVADLLAELGLA